MEELIEAFTPFFFIFIFLYALNKLLNARQPKKTPPPRQTQPANPPQAAARTTATPTMPSYIRDAHLDIFSGSLGDEVHEGDDPCHPDQVHGPHVHEAMPPMALEAETGITSWSPMDLKKAMVMQEILTRPCDRKRRT